MLNNLHVLVTRPEPKNSQLCALIAEAGGHAFNFPTIEFHSLTATQDFLEKISLLGEQEWLIFISPQAVAESLPILKKYWPIFPETVHLAAVGAGTAQALADAGYKNVQLPHEEWDSEGLLALPQFQQVKNKKIAIIRGAAGREMLDKKLQERGAIVLTLLAYERILPKPKNLIPEDARIDISICTSGEGVENLKKLVSHTKWQQIIKQPLLTMSERIKKLANELGFKTVWVVPPPKFRDDYIESKKINYNKTLLEALAQYKDEIMTNTAPLASEVEKKPSTKWKKIGVSLCILGFGIILSALLYGFYALYAANLNVKKVLTFVETQQKIQQQSIHDLQNSVKSLHDNAKKSAELYQQQEKVMSEWDTAQKGNLDKWRIAEAQYLVKLANDYLQFSNNISMALKLLQGADGVLQKVTNINVFELRKALANEMTRLHSAPEVDVTAVYLQLNALNNEIDRLPLPITPLKKEIKTAVEKPLSPDLPWWKVIFHKGWNAINKVVVVHYTGSDALPLILPEEKSFLLQNLHAQLENAMWGVLHRKAEIYKTSLERAQAWIQQYFLQDELATKTFLTKIDELKTLSVDPVETNVTTTLHEFNTYLS